MNERMESLALGTLLGTSKEEGEEGDWGQRTRYLRYESETGTSQGSFSHQQPNPPPGLPRVSLPAGASPGGESEPTWGKQEGGGGHRHTPD